MANQAKEKRTLGQRAIFQIKIQRELDADPDLDGVTLAIPPSSGKPLG